MELREFLPNLWLTELVLEDFEVRGAVIIGEERALVWDTLSHPRDMYPIAKLAQKKPVYVVYSHADWDHCWGTGGLESGLIIAHETCMPRFKNGEVAKKLADKQLESPGTWDAVRLFPPTLTFKHTITIDLGGTIVELHHLPGHTEDCLVAFIPKSGVFLAGDTVETPLPYLNTGETLPHWIEGLERWNEDEGVQIVIPSHGEIGDRTLIRHNLDYLRALYEGTEPDVPSEMTAFYTETHAKNLAMTRRT